MIARTKLAELHETIRACTKCPLHKVRNKAVPGEGSINTKVVFVGEAPGRQEDKTGKPFVGRSGELLTRLIEDRLHYGREEVFITSVLKCRPPNNRTPHNEEMQSCLPYLKEQLDVINPDVIVLLGGVAISALVGYRKVSDVHGTFHDNEYRYFMTYHPAAALRFSKYQTLIESDFDRLGFELA